MNRHIIRMSLDTNDLLARMNDLHNLIEYRQNRLFYHRAARIEQCGVSDGNMNPLRIVIDTNNLLKIVFTYDSPELCNRP